MITASHPPPRGHPGRHVRPRRPRRPGWTVFALAVFVTLVGAGTIAVGGLVPGLAIAGFDSADDAGRDDRDQDGGATSEPTSLAAPTASPLATPTATPTPAPGATAGPTVYRLSGTPPYEGDGTFAYGRTTGEIAGTAGPIRRYRIAVENGSREDVEEFGALVDAALSDERSWHAGGTVRLRRVASGQAYDFTVYLATAATAHDMCLRGGTNNKVNGRSYTSCRATRQVIINLDRWRLSVNHLVQAKVPLDSYRDYVINHEVGHELGNRHVGCPGQGRPAPVMMQQTLFLNGCKPNAWPYVDGRRYTGPAL